MAQRTVMIHFGESQVLKRQVAHPFQGLVDRNFSAPHLLQKRAE
jgi:hypothetical protein